ncbi:properdin isoform X1 [Electrophorus electricus]|nr:properdin isoform X1 [Electrophorus electricus]
MHRKNIIRLLNQQEQLTKKVKVIRLWNIRKLFLHSQPTKKTTMLFMIALLLLHIQPTVPQMVQCYSSFSLKDGTCVDILGQVPLDDCCMNPKYSYQENGKVCKSCRYAEWTEWSQWGACSVTCSEGVRQRHRGCYGIGKCQDPYKIGDLQTEPCTEGCCQENGGWSEWGAWSPCSVTCENGVKKRTRTCTEPPPKCGGFCLGNSEETEDCNIAIVCPTHGGWSPWGKWGPCAGTCHPEGFLAPEQQRQRTCTNPPPSTVPRGNDCSGARFDSKHCKGIPFCPVDGNWGAWSMASDCSVTCGVGRQRQQRKCDNPQPKHSGRPCQGADTRIHLCTIPVHCPADGHWSEWSEWTLCKSVNQREIVCRNRMGRRKRERDCLGREYEGNFCLGEPVEFGTCYNIMNCKSGPSEQIVGAFWSEWSKWSYCKPNCGENSTQTRQKKCIPDLSKYSNKNIEFFSGTPNINCPQPEDTEQTRSCFNVPKC